MKKLITLGLIASMLLQTVSATNLTAEPYDPVLRRIAIISEPWEEDDRSPVNVYTHGDLDNMPDWSEADWIRSIADAGYNNAAGNKGDMYINNSQSLNQMYNDFLLQNGHCDIYTIGNYFQGLGRQRNPKGSYVNMSTYGRSIQGNTLNRAHYDKTLLIDEVFTGKQPSATSRIYRYMAGDFTNGAITYFETVTLINDNLSDVSNRWRPWAFYGGDGYVIGRFVTDPLNNYRNLAKEIFELSPDNQPIAVFQGEGNHRVVDPFRAPIKKGDFALALANALKFYGEPELPEDVERVNYVSMIKNIPLVKSPKVQDALKYLYTHGILGEKFNPTEVCDKEFARTLLNRAKNRNIRLQIKPIEYVKEFVDQGFTPIEVDVREVPFSIEKIVDDKGKPFTKKIKVSKELFNFYDKTGEKISASRVRLRDPHSETNISVAPTVENGFITFNIKEGDRINKVNASIKNTRLEFMKLVIAKEYDKAASLLSTNEISLFNNTPVTSSEVITFIDSQLPKIREYILNHIALRIGYRYYDPEYYVGLKDLKQRNKSSINEDLPILRKLVDKSKHKELGLDSNLRKDVIVNKVLNSQSTSDSNLEYFINSFTLNLVSALDLLQGVDKNNIKKLEATTGGKNTGKFIDERYLVVINNSASYGDKVRIIDAIDRELFEKLQSNEKGNSISNSGIDTAVDEVEDMFNDYLIFSVENSSSLQNDFYPQNIVLYAPDIMRYGGEVYAGEGSYDYVKANSRLQVEALEDTYTLKKNEQVLGRLNFKTYSDERTFRIPVRVKGFKGQSNLKTASVTKYEYASKGSYFIAAGDQSIPSTTPDFIFGIKSPNNDKSSDLETALRAVAVGGTLIPGLKLQIIDSSKISQNAPRNIFYFKVFDSTGKNLQYIPKKLYSYLQGATGLTGKDSPLKGAKRKNLLFYAKGNTIVTEEDKLIKSAMKSELQNTSAEKDLIFSARLENIIYTRDRVMNDTGKHTNITDSMVDSVFDGLGAMSALVEKGVLQTFLADNGSGVKTIEPIKTTSKILRDMDNKGHFKSISNLEVAPVVTVPGGKFSFITLESMNPEANYFILKTLKNNTATDILIIQNDSGRNLYDILKEHGIPDDILKKRLKDTNLLFEEIPFNASSPLDYDSLDPLEPPRFTFTKEEGIVENVLAKFDTHKPLSIYNVQSYSDKGKAYMIAPRGFARPIETFFRLSEYSVDFTKNENIKNQPNVVFQYKSKEKVPSYFEDYNEKTDVSLGSFQGFNLHYRVPDEKLLMDISGSQTTSTSDTVTDNGKKNEEERRIVPAEATEEDAVDPARLATKISDIARLKTLDFTSIVMLILLRVIPMILIAWSFVWLLILLLAKLEMFEYISEKVDIFSILSFNLTDYDKVTRNWIYYMVSSISTMALLTLFLNLKNLEILAHFLGGLLNFM